jgi:hypothetical protein
MFRIPFNFTCDHEVAQNMRSKQFRSIVAEELAPLTKSKQWPKIQFTAAVAVTKLPE